MNAITKSGTNTFRGTAYVYHKNENMRGDAVDGDQISGARAKDRTTTFGFTLGGPIVKNKLFFFVNAEMSKIPSVVNRWKGSTDGKADANNYISRTTVSDLQAVKDYVADKYGYDTGSYSDFPADDQGGGIEPTAPAQGAGCRIHAGPHVQLPSGRPDRTQSLWYRESAGNLRPSA